MLMTSCSQKTPLEKVLESDSEIIQKVVQNHEKYELQIIYTKIDRNSDPKTVFQDYRYRVDDNTYFYPASSVKFPIALIALEKLKELKEKGINIDRKTYFTTENDSIYTSIEKCITEIFAVSDNDAYNKLFEFLGQDHINQRLVSKGLQGRISHRLSTDNASDLSTKPVIFKRSIRDSLPIHKQESIKNKPISELRLNKLYKGKGFIRGDSLINTPMDFSGKNHLSLTSLHEMMKRIQFPELYSGTEVFDINPDNREFVLKAMKTLPKEAGYDKKEYYDSYSKFFIFGDSKQDIPDHIQIFNKVGYAYGYLTDIAYIKDTENNIEFLLSATIHVNENEIYNDNNYEYDDIGIPFLAELGRKIYELERKK